MSANHFVSASCEGELCTIRSRSEARGSVICGLPATHKLAEVVQHDDPNPVRHELTVYACCAHFVQIMGPAAQCFKS